MNEMAIANRPTSQHIAELFKKYGITPIPYAYLVGRHHHGSCCGCAIGALLVEALGSVEAAFDQSCGGDEPELLGRLTELPETFLKGLDQGFSYGLSTDGQRLWNQYHYDPLYVEGFDIGRTVRDLVLPDPPQESTNACDCQPTDPRAHCGSLCAVRDHA
jgi:hypothetical protein